MKRRRTHTDDGLPRAAAEWTAEDWRDLNDAMRTAITRIAARHRKDTPGEEPGSPTAGTPLASLPLSVRTRNALETIGILTAEQAAAMLVRHLLAGRNIGLLAAQELADAIRPLGLRICL